MAFPDQSHRAPKFPSNLIALSKYEAALTQLVVLTIGGIAWSRKPGIERRPDRWPSSGTVDSEVASHHENPGRMTKGTSHGIRGRCTQQESGAASLVRSLNVAAQLV